MVNFNRTYSAEEKEIVRRKAIEAMDYIGKMAKLNGTSEMTLEEINEEITAARRERRERENAFVKSCY